MLLTRRPARGADRARGGELGHRGRAWPGHHRDRRRGMDMLPEDQRHDHAAGLILAFEVDNLGAEMARLQAEGVTVTMPLRSEEWGERAFQVRDPNGVIIELLDWNAGAGG